MGQAAMSDSPAQALEVKGLDIFVAAPGGPNVITAGVEFIVRAGTVHGIAGESGSGKSLSAQAVMGLLPENMVFEGSVRLDGREISMLSERGKQAVRGKDVAMVFQDPMSSMHPMLTIGKQMTEHMRLRGGISKRAAFQRARNLLGEVRLPDPDWSLKAYPHQFSGGMRQRLAIAMALAREPRLLIADEPTTALDVTVQAGILRLIKSLCDNHNLGVLLITHDLGVMSAIADDLSILYAGRIVESGACAQLLQSPRHPYTDRLLAALPRRGSAGSGLVPIPGSPATPRDRPSGCAFHPRCLHAAKSCAEEIPELIAIGDGRRMACPVDPLKPRTFE